MKKCFQGIKFLVLGFLFLVLSFRCAFAVRIVSLLPSNTEILESLGAGDQVIGITRFDHASPGKEIIGDFLQPSLEKIVALKPDLIVAGYSASNRTVARLRNLGYRVEEVRNPRSLDELYGSIRDLARLVQKEKEAVAVIGSMQARLALLKERAAHRKRRFRTFIEIDPPFWTVGGRDFMSEALACAGADNLFSDLERPSAQVSPEVIIERNPEVILSFELKKSAIERRPGWSRLAAVQRGWIIDDLDRDALSRPSPGLIPAVEALSDRLDSFQTP